MSATVGVLLAQVGTPEAPTPKAVRAYLSRFLSDRRIVDYPFWLWQPLLRGVILPLRGRKSARLYQRIWTAEGSPLLVESERQRVALQAALGSGYRVVLGMAYAGPTFEKAIDDLLAAGIDDVIVLPRGLPDPTRARLAPKMSASLSSPSLVPGCSACSMMACFSAV